MLYAVIREWDGCGNGFVRAVADTPQGAFDLMTYYYTLATLTRRPANLSDWSIWEWDMVGGLGECVFTRHCDAPPIVHALDEWAVLS